MEGSSENALVSNKPSDTGITASLHPLVLLTASDQITRHRVREETAPVAGILLGQQKGREITAEHAFPAGFEKSDGGKWTFKQPWLEERVQQFRDVHKVPALDVVGWYTLCPESGPRADFVPFQQLVTSVYNDSAILLAIHPEAFQPTQAVNQKLPISVYESIIEAEQPKDETSMQVDGKEKDVSELKFRPIPYTIETDEAEMIAINYVAKGAGSAAAIPDASTTSTQPNSKPEASAPPAEAISTSTGKGKAPANAKTEDPKPSTNGNTQPDLSTLTTEEADTLSTLTTRLNSVRMLQSRLNLLTSFLHTIPPSYLTDSSIPLTPESPDPAHLPYLRQIQALLTRLNLLTPPSNPDPTSQPNPLEAAQQAQANDVRLTQLLGLLNRDVQALSELGRKFNAVEGNKMAGKKGGKGSGGGGGIGGAGMAEEMMGIGGPIFGGISSVGGGSGGSSAGAGGKGVMI